MFKKIKNFIERLDSIGLENERNLFVENIALLIASGMGISTSLAALGKETKSRPMKRIIGKIEEDVNAGSAFWRALEATKIFSPHTISLVKIGEDSGRLEENLKVIAVQEEKDRDFRSKLHSAMVYPAFVFGLTLLIGIGVAWFILPKLSSVFGSLKMDLPLVTKVLISVGVFLDANGKVFVPLLLFAIFLLMFFLFSFSKTKFIGQSILFHLPGTKRLMQQVELSRLGYMLGTLLEAGITVNEAMNSLIEASVFAPYKNFYKFLLSNIEDGNSFQKSFSSYPGLDKLIPSSVQQMIINGEKSGFLSTVLLKIGTSYEKKIEDTTKNLAVILEPVLLVIVWLGVVAVAMAVILPIYSLVGGFGESTSKKQAPKQATIVIPKIIENNVATSTKTQEKEGDDEILTTPDLLEKELESSSLNLSASSTEPVLSKIEIDNITQNKLVISDSVLSSLNVRAEPSTNSEIVAKIKAGEIFEYVEKNNSWHKIILNDNKYGWIMSEFITELQ